jgi:hypothetical protein
MIISLYAGGMTVRDIQHHLARTLGTELSHDTISTITDAVLEEVKAWQTRPLEEIYPIIYLDALVVKVRDGHQVRNRAAHIAVGIDLDGVKHVLGIWVQTSEGAKFWAGVRRAAQPRHPRRAHRLLRRAHRLPRGDRGHLAAGHRADLHGALLRGPGYADVGGGSLAGQGFWVGDVGIILVVDRRLVFPSLERRASWSRCCTRVWSGRWSRMRTVSPGILRGRDIRFTQPAICWGWWRI